MTVIIKLLFLLILLLATVVTPSFSIDSDLAPLISYPDDECIPNQYIVVFKEGATNKIITNHHDDINAQLYKEKKRFKRGLLKELMTGIEYTYEFDTFRGYAGKFSESVLSKIRESDDVSLIYSAQYLKSLHRSYLDRYYYLSCVRDKKNYTHTFLEIP